jgi:hypothetical protein
MVDVINITVIVTFEVFTAVTVMNNVFWDVTMRGSCKNRRLRETYILHHQGENWCSRITVMMGAIRSSETSVLTRVTRCNIPVDDVRHSHCCENLKSYIALTGWTL